MKRDAAKVLYSNYRDVSKVLQLCTELDICMTPRVDVKAKMEAEVPK